MESVRKHYELSFYTGDLRSDIADRLAKLYPDKSIEDLTHIADDVISDISKQGNMALYQGLVLYGVRLAKDKYQKLYM